MFKELLIEWVQDLYSSFATVGQSGILSLSLSQFNGELLSYVQTISETVVMPMAYTVLALFYVLELHKASIEMERSGNSRMHGVEVIFKTMFKMLFCKMAIEKSWMIMLAIFNVSLELIDGIAGIVSAASLDLSAEATAQIETFADAFEDGFLTDIGPQIGMMTELSMLRPAVKIIIGLINVMCVARFLEIYAYIAVSPLPLATFPSVELSQIGKNYLKSYAAVCIKGAFMYLALAFFPIIVDSGILGDATMWNLILYSLILGIMVIGSQAMAKSVCNAM